MTPRLSGITRSISASRNPDLYLPFQTADNFATVERAERQRRCRWRLAEHLGIPYSSYMSPLRARVEKGRLVLDEPTTLPEGTIVDLVADDEGDDLTNDERRALHEALLTSWRSAKSRIGGGEIVLPHRTCSPTNSLRRSTSLGTHHTSGACIGNPRYRTRVVSYSRELAITCTMSRGVTR